MIRFFFYDVVSVLGSHDIVIPTGSSSRGGDVAVHVFDITQPSLPTPFYSVLLPVSVLWPIQLYFIP